MTDRIPQRKGNNGRGGGRLEGFAHSHVTRQRMRASSLMFRLYKCAKGELEMTTSQLVAANSFLDRVVPRLKSIEHTGEVAFRQVTELTDAELVAIATSRSAGALEAPRGAHEPGIVYEVHDPAMARVEDSQGDMRAA